jgi:hypothetical protein
MKLMKWVVAIGLLSWTPSGFCITNGSFDNNRHSNVGTIVAEYLTPGVKDQACTGTLISATVFLTAGHCIALLQGMGVAQVWVTFDPVFSSSATLYPGAMHLNPSYPGRGASDPEDLGVIVLDVPVAGISPAALPSQDLLDPYPLTAVCEILYSRLSATARLTPCSEEDALIPRKAEAPDAMPRKGS